METGNYFVYKHTAPNGKVYIGITSKNPLLRWGKNGIRYKNNLHFYNAILKYGWDNFNHEILFSHITQEEAEKKEIELIAEYKSNQREFGYNHAIGGAVNRGYHFCHTEEYKRKVRARMVGNHNFGDQRGQSNNFFGKHHSEETKQKISEAQYDPVLQYDKQGNFIAEYANSYQAQLQTGILHILECCKKVRKSAGGYMWRFKLELREKQLEDSKW